MAENRIRVYSKITGKKLANPVPESWLRIFPNLSRTPRQEVADHASAKVVNDAGDTAEPVSRPRRRRNDATPPEAPSGPDTTSDTTSPTEE